MLVDLYVFVIWLFRIWLLVFFRPFTACSVNKVLRQLDASCMQGVALAPKILEPKKLPILIFCRQFSNIEAQKNVSKNLDNSTNIRYDNVTLSPLLLQRGAKADWGLRYRIYTNMYDIKLDEGFIVYYYNND